MTQKSSYSALALIVFFITGNVQAADQGSRHSASAPQITGVLGSPNATTTIDGKQLPPTDPKFGGVIKDDALQSKFW